MEPTGSPQTSTSVTETVLAVILGVLALVGFTLLFLVFTSTATAHAQAVPVNSPGGTAVPQLFAGKPGVCFDEALARDVRDKALVLLPGCETNLKLAGGSLASTDAALEIAKRQIDYYAQALVAREKQIEELAKQRSDKPSRAVWALVGAGVAAAVIAGTLLLYPKIASVGRANSGLSERPRSPVAPLRGFGWVW